jgi:predicted aldo/keto reductase-like oxidoreductase
MAYRRFGRTGELVSILGVGGFHIGIQRDPQDSVSLIREAIDSGVNFLDNAWEYNDGASEERMGLALRDGYRDRAFVMTKVCGRDRATATSNLEDSLRRLGTDVIDLWMFHECNYARDPDLVFANGGAIHAALEARQMGKVRFIGFTGHKTADVHRRMIEQGFAWDAVLMPMNLADAHHDDSFTRHVVPLCQERDIGVIAMKSLGGTGEILSGAPVSVEECLRYSMSLAASVLICGMDSARKLRQNIAAAKAFVPFAPGQREELLARVAPHAPHGRLERFKSTIEYDSSIHRGQHGMT